MRRHFVIASLLLVAPLSALAQDGDHAYRGQGYVFFGLGDSPALFEHVGGGVEGFLYKGLAVGGEAGYVHWGSGYGQALIGPADCSFHFGRHAARGKADPFVLGGVSVLGPNQSANGRGTATGTFGGGVNWWQAEHVALRFEVREVLRSDFLEYNQVSFRIGVTFR